PNKKVEPDRKDKEEKEKEEKPEAKPTPKAAPPTPLPKSGDKSGQKNGQVAAIDSQLQKAMQRYLGSSTDAGGQGFGAARLGGKGTGGGVVRPPEFFRYREILVHYIKGGWKWPDRTQPLIAQAEFFIDPDGTIRHVTIALSSGNERFDDSVIRAVEKASPLPP